MTTVIANNSEDIMSSVSSYIDLIKSRFLLLGDPDVSEQKIRYMKNHFDFYGLLAKIWIAELKDIFKEKGLLNGPNLVKFVEDCYEDEYREIHYAAIQMVEKNQKNTDKGFIDTLEFMIINRSWWDSVDWIAKLVGIHFEKHPELIIPTTERWIKSDNMWLQRVSIIFQLRYKEKTNQELLFKYCKYKSMDKEFFIRKAIGWALRQYSKTSPEAVVTFVQNTPLSNLSKKEALRLIK